MNPNGLTEADPEAGPPRVRTTSERVEGRRFTPHGDYTSVPGVPMAGLPVDMPPSVLHTTILGEFYSL
jgi:hypothetical protein